MPSKPKPQWVRVAEDMWRLEINGWTRAIVFKDGAWYAVGPLGPSKPQELREAGPFFYLRTAKSAILQVLTEAGYAE